MDRKEELRRKEWKGCIMALVGMVILLFSPFYASRDVSRTVFFTLFFLSIILLVVGLTIGDNASKQRKVIKVSEFYNHYTKCPHCSGSGWVKKA
jgi:hypothetical protein